MSSNAKTDSGGNAKGETPLAAQAFADYVAMPPNERSLRNLADKYVAQNRYKTDTTALNQLRTWSTKYQWQLRLTEATTAETERRLQEAAERDAESFLKFSRLIAITADMALAGNIVLLPQDLVKLRESVRKPQARGSTNVSVQLDVSFTQAIERIAEEDGLTDSERRELEADVRNYLATKP